MMTRRALALAALGLIVAGPAPADCQSGDFEGTPYTACTATPGADDLRLWLRDEDGTILGTFERVRRVLAEEGADLGFAMNAGMFHDDRTPVGHYVEDFTTEQSVITSAGPGNFGMLPNAVFCIGDGWAQVIESRAYAAAPPDCRFATQSGPMLVNDGALHPRFIPDGSSRFLRNGVGVRLDGSVVAVISDRPINFHDFARLFRDRLETPNALYLDGKVSRLFIAEDGRNDMGFPVGPIFGTVISGD